MRSCTAPEDPREEGVGAMSAARRLSSILRAPGKGPAHVAQLVVLNGVAIGTVFVLGDVPAVVGRSPEAHLRVGDPWISSMHAMFERRHDGLWVVDLESRNGVFVKDERVSEAPVPDGAVVRLGRTQIRFSTTLSSASEIPRPPDGAPPPPPPRETVRADGNPTAAPVRARATPHAPVDPQALARRSATVLRMAVDDAGLELSPENARRLREAVEAAVDAAVHEGAAVARLAGVGVLALFGLEDPEPRDAARALAAARAARRAVAEAGGLTLRAGIESGEVLAGHAAGPSGTELAALGPAAERAERLVALARPGEILAGPGAAAAAGLEGGALRRIGDLEIEVFRDES
jgi:class 3 adenylate cyclase